MPTELEWIVASNLSTIRRGNPDMGGPMATDFRNAEKLIGNVQLQGYVILASAEADALLHFFGDEPEGELVECIRRQRGE